MQWSILYGENNFRENYGITYLKISIITRLGSQVEFM